MFSQTLFCSPFLLRRRLTSTLKTPDTKRATCFTRHPRPFEASAPTLFQAQGTPPILFWRVLQSRIRRRLEAKQKRIRLNLRCHECVRTNCYTLLLEQQEVQPLATQDDCTAGRHNRNTTTTALPPVGTTLTHRRGARPQRRRRLRRVRNSGAGLAHPAERTGPLSRLLSTLDESKSPAGGADPSQLAAQEQARGDGQDGEWWQQSAGAGDGPATPDAPAADEKVFRVAAANERGGSRGG